MAGDLNACSKTIGCSYQNESGNILERALTDFDFVLLNDHSPTHEKNNILDLFICSPDLAHNFEEFRVDDSSCLGSDHFPVQVGLNFCPFRVNPNKEIKLNIAKTDWEKYKSILNSKKSDNLEPEKLQDFITNSIIETIKICTPVYKNTSHKNELPREIINLIKEKRKVRNLFKKTNIIDLKQKYNKLTQTIKSKISEFKTNNWDVFLNKLGPNPLSSKPFWQKINKFKKKGSDSIKDLKVGEKIYTDEKSKCQIFGNQLENTFKIDPSEAFDKKFEEEVLTFLKTEQEKHKPPFNDFKNFNTKELTTAIKKLKSKSAMGPDEIHNLYLKNLPPHFLNYLLVLFNSCVRNNCYPEVWKLALVKMLPKKNSNLSEPSSYRPISITSCLGKLYERLIANRLREFLESKNILTKIQSGFRTQRSTTDNILFLTQKITESFNNKKNLIATFFDISKAFDKVWHQGLIYKMHKYNIPKYIIIWTATFLKDRKFKIKINSSISEEYSISAGVPQGAVVSPILFNIYINDIPQLEKINSSYTNLFADDLITFSIYKKNKRLTELKLNRYLNELEKWLLKFKMKICAAKCSYTIFSRNKKQLNTFNFNLKIFNEQIPKAKNPKFLGITFDPFLSFGEHIANIQKQAENRLNILKIISHKSWKLKTETLFNIYKTLISSLFNYSSFCANLISHKWLKKLQIIQNSAVRIIFKLPYDTPTSELISIAEAFKIPMVKERLFNLNKNYLSKNLESSNPLINKLVDEYKKIFLKGKNILKPTPLCASYSTIEQFYGN